METKTLDLTPMKWVQEKNTRNAAKNKAKLYHSEVARRNRRKRIIKITCATIITAGIIGAIALYNRVPEPVVAKEPTTEIAEEQPYIVRYGVVDGFTDDGDMMIVTDDGNLWTIVDPPELDNGTEVRIVFASNGTLTAADDEVIDITER